MAHVAGELTSARAALRRVELTPRSLGEIVQLLGHLCQHVVERDNSDQLAIADHGNAPDAMCRHQLDDAIERIMGARHLKRLAHDVGRVRRVLGIDSVQIETAEERGAVASDAALAYLTRLAKRTGDLEVATVPPFLADKLREEDRWSIRYDALDEVLDLARTLRTADSTSSGRRP